MRQSFFMLICAAVFIPVQANAQSAGSLDCSPFSAKELRAKGLSKKDLAPGAKILGAPYHSEAACSTQKPLFIKVTPYTANCPNGWITRTNKSKERGVRYQLCALCGEGYSKTNLRYGRCCQK
jgi:hypothetical protein